MLTVIEFDAKNGKPTWRNVDTGKFLHKLDDYRALEAFTAFEREWFRKPLGR